eukprot:TRINITY_DN773416_c0_g1_i1.p1 TRINITY_DN773416_c0_g1~~TRINITY_DN773416_c0_g1_i1.p1  ORF type:complete len:233 (-),score=42.49 TRINITY_DN773416_c0_g1_i1:181-879(-)
MRIIGVTGGVGCGKSTFCRFVRERGYETIEVDKVKKFVALPGKPAYRKIVQTFGEDILLEDGFIDYAKLSGLVFGDRSKRRQLCKATDKYIYLEIIMRLVKSFFSCKSIVFLDSALLFESKSDKVCSKVVALITPSELKIDRLIKRTGWSVDHINDILNSQIPPEVKAARSDYVVSNDGTLEDLEQEVDDVIVKLQQPFFVDLLRKGFILFVLLAVFVGGMKGLSCLWSGLS